MKDVCLEVQHIILESGKTEKFSIKADCDNSFILTISKSDREKTDQFTCDKRYVHNIFKTLKHIGILKLKSSNFNSEILDGEIFKISGCDMTTKAAINLHIINPMEAQEKEYINISLYLQKFFDQYRIKLFFIIQFHNIIGKILGWGKSREKGKIREGKIRVGPN